MFTKIEIEKDTKFLVGLDTFLLITIISFVIIYEMFRDLIGIYESMYIALLIGLAGIVGILRLFQKQKDKEKEKNGEINEMS